MMGQNSAELFWLACVALLTSVMWMPYIVQLIAQMGPVAALLDRFHETPHDARWAQRAKRAHANAVENLVVFAPLAIAVYALDAGTALTATASAVYFFARAGHYVVYVLAVPLFRTLLFAVGFVCQWILGLTLLGWL